MLSLCLIFVPSIFSTVPESHGWGGGGEGEGQPMDVLFLLYTNNPFPNQYFYICQSFIATLVKIFPSVPVHQSLLSIDYTFQICCSKPRQYSRVSEFFLWLCSHTVNLCIEKNPNLCLFSIKYKNPYWTYT